MHKYCGLDFGTSNSAIGVNSHGRCQLVPLQNDKPIIRSAIFCDNELHEWLYGQEGIDCYLDGIPGRLMMSIKSVLGSPIMEDETLIFNEMISYTAILSHFIQHIKSIAENKIQHELTQVVIGRPVRFHDNDNKMDAEAQNTLEKIARMVGFEEVSFQFEPIAAALAYETSITKEQLALIIDMGGGTSDFTIIRLRPGVNKANRSDDVLANCGIHIAGTDFDQALSLETIMPMLGMGSLIKGSSSDIEMPSMYYYDLTAWHTLNNLYKPATLAHLRTLHMAAYEKELIARLIHVLKIKAGHHILHAVEMSKQELSTKTKVITDISFIEDKLNMLITRETFNGVIAGHLEKIMSTIQQTVKTAGIVNGDISAIFYTGGTTKIPIIQEKINALFPNAEIILGDVFGSVGLGLTIDAQRKYG
ncbi:MAG: Hsp70 family protein [Gammaproteobacteria bacterium]|nr:Hsp70 family protein [Gammaproteobacteria bacterium]